MAGIFLALSCLIDYASLAGDLVHNHVSSLVFLRYWPWNLPTFLAVVLPLAFLLGGAPSLSEPPCPGMGGHARWRRQLPSMCRAGFRGWGAVAALTFLLEGRVAPPRFQRADPLYRQIIGRPAPLLNTRPSWMNLGSTGVAWFLMAPCAGSSPQAGLTDSAGPAQVADARTSTPWPCLGTPSRWFQDPQPLNCFPSRALQDSTSAEETPTRDLFERQKWV